MEQCCQIFSQQSEVEIQNIAYTHVYIILIFFTEDENGPKLKLRQPSWAPKGKIHHKSGHSFHFRSFQTWKWFTIFFIKLLPNNGSEVLENGERSRYDMHVMHVGYLCNAPKDQNIRAKKNMTKVNFWEDHVISTAKVLTQMKGFPTSNENDSCLAEFWGLPKVTN